MIYTILNEAHGTIKFKGVSVEYNEKDSEYLAKDISVLKSNYSDIIKSEEDKQNIKAKKLMSVEYRRLKNGVSQFHLSFESNEDSHILSIVAYISENKVKNLESWVDG